MFVCDSLYLLIEQIYLGNSDEVFSLYKNLKIVAVITTLIMVFVQIGGALVTKTGSAEGCGDSWPLCHGQLIPKDWPLDTIIEIAHRGVSLVAIIFLIIFGVMAWKQLSHIRETKFLVCVSLSFILIQSLIGAAAVVGLWHGEFVLAAHFGISLICFAAVFVLTLLVFHVDLKYDTKGLIIHKGLRRHTIGIIIYIYFVIYSGALVRHADASLACTRWPHCMPHQIMPTNFYQAVQMGHRFLVLILFIWMVIAMIHVLRYYSNYRVIKNGWIIMMILLVLQIITGALTIFTYVNIFIALFHALFITLIFGILCYYILLISRPDYEP